MAGALAGVRVLELAEGVSGPYCGKLLAGLGADVLKLEHPTGDRTRGDGPFRGEERDPEGSGLFLHLNTNKRSTVEADLESLLAEADVVVIAKRPAEMLAEGIDYEAWRRRHPR